MSFKRLKKVLNQFERIPNSSSSATFIRLVKSPSPSAMSFAVSTSLSTGFVIERRTRKPNNKLMARPIIETIKTTQMKFSASEITFLFTESDSFLNE